MRPRRVTVGPTDQDFDASVDSDAYHDAQAMPARARRLPFGRTLFALAIVGVATVPLTWLALHVFVDPGQLATWIEPRASAALQREVTVGSAGIALLPRPGVRASDVRIDNREGVGGPAVIAVDRVHMDVSLTRLLVGSVSLRRARLDGVRVHLSVDEAGRSNFGDLVPEGGPTPTALPAPIGWAVTEVLLSDAAITYFDSNRDRSFALAGWNGSFDVGTADGSWTVEGGAAADSLHLRLPNISDEIVRTRGPAVAVRIRGDGRLDGLEVERAMVEQSGQTLLVTGRLERLGRDDARVDLAFENPAFEVGVLRGLFSPDLRERLGPAPEGTVSLALNVRGPLGAESPPPLRGRIGLGGVSVHLDGEALVEAVDGTVLVGADRLRLDSIRGRFAEGPFALSGSVGRDAPTIDLLATGSPDVAALDRLGFGPEGYRLDGSAELDLAVSGSWAAPDSLEVTGMAALRGLRVSHEGIGVPLYVPTADVTISDGAMRWSDLTVMVGEEPLTTSGSLASTHPVFWRASEPPALEATLGGAALDLGGVLPREGVEAPPTYARLAFAHLGAREIDGRTAVAWAHAAGFRRPRALPLTGSVALDLAALEYHDLALDSVRATLVFTDSTLAVQDGAFGVWGGRVQGALVLGVGNGLDEPFALTLGAESLDAAPFFATLSPLGEAVRGSLTLAVEVRGTTDMGLLPGPGSVEGGGSIEVANGSFAGTGLNHALADFLSVDDWADVPFERGSMDLVFTEGHIDLRESLLAGPLGRVHLAGSIGFDGAADLAMGLSIPPQRLRAVSLRRTGVAQSVLDRLRASNSPLDLGIRVSGSVQGPTLEPDALAGPGGG